VVEYNQTDIRARLLQSVGGDYKRFESWFNQRTFLPERLATGALDGWAADFAETAKNLAAVGATADQVDQWIAGAVKRWAAFQSAGSRTLNWMITGPARFPVTRNQKRMDVEHKRLDELMDYAKGWQEWLSRQTRRAERAALAEVSAVTEHQEREVGGIRVVHNTTLDRIQLFFDGKPDAETIAALKGAAFRWSPREGAWQRQLTANGLRAADRILAWLSTEEA